MRQFILLGVDVVLILLATSLGFALRENFEIAQVHLEAFLPYLCATALVAVVFFAAAGVNKCIWRFSSTHDYLRVSVVITGISVGAVATSFAYNRLEGVARSLPVLQVIMGIMILVGARVIHRLRHMARQRKRAAKALLHQPAKAYQLNILVVGVSRLTETYIQALNELGSGRVNVAGIIGSTSRQVGRLVASHPVLGVARDIENVLARLEVHGVIIDRIVVAMPLEQLASEILEPLLLVEQSRSIPLQFLTEALDLDSGSPRGGSPFPATASPVCRHRACKARGSFAALLLESEERAGCVRCTGASCHFVSRFYSHCPSRGGDHRLSCGFLAAKARFEGKAISSL